MTNLEQMERELRIAGAPTSMAEAVRTVADLETPGLSKKMTDHLVGAIEGTAARMEEAARILLDQAASLRSDAYKVSDNIASVIMRARRLDEQTTATLAAFRAMYEAEKLS